MAGSYTDVRKLDLERSKRIQSLLVIPKPPILIKKHNIEFPRFKKYWVYNKFDAEAYQQIEAILPF